MKILINNKLDNVGTCVKEKGIRKGEKIDYGNIISKSYIPFGHKILLNSTKKDDPIIRYGYVIGYCLKDLEKGSLISQYNNYIKKSDDLKSFDKQFRISKSNYNLIDLSDNYFMGYLNDDGSVGTKNILAINTTVQCSSGVVNKAVDILRNKYLKKYPNVDDVVALNHIYGCGVAINGQNSEIPKKTIKNMAYNPNFGGERLIVSLGCEKLLAKDLFSDINRDDLIILQEENGFEEMVLKIINKAEMKLKRLNLRKRSKQPLSKLNVGVQCGGSDAFSGITANPLIGYVVDSLANIGAKVCFSEVTEVRDGAEILLERMESEKVRQQFIKDLKWYDDYLSTGKVDRSENPAPGNKAGGLINVVDKAMGSINKSGFSPIIDSVSYGERLKKNGLSFLATPASDFVCGTQQIAGGVTLQLFATGRGTPYNLREYPIIKISSNSILKKKWFDIIDYDAGVLLEGETSIEEEGKKLLELIIEIASGKMKTCADKLELYNDLAVFNPAPIT